MSKFTPGPWDVTTSGDYYNTYHIGDVGTEISTEEDEANTRLIRKAPEMYDMIEELRKVLITVYDARNNAFAVMMEKYLATIKELQEEIDKVD